MNKLEFRIKKISHSTGENVDLSAIPMMMRRKLSPIGKIAMSTLLDCYGENSGDIKLVYASRYGELERVVKLIKQEHEDNEISPAGFSFSVHNSTIGLFSLLKNIHSSYNSVAGGEESFSAGLLDAVMNREKTLFCYAESVDRYESIAILIDYEDGEKVAIRDNSENLPSNNFIDFIQGRKFVCPLYIMERIND